ncbi:hypothetical protein BgiBS90_019323, partial [Biomphalaria glabrata]
KPTLSIDFKNCSTAVENGTFLQCLCILKELNYTDVTYRWLNKNNIIIANTSLLNTSVDDNNK